MDFMNEENEKIPNSKSSILGKLDKISIGNNSTSAFNREFLDVAIFTRNKVGRELVDDRLSSRSLGFSSNILQIRGKT